MTTLLEDAIAQVRKLPAAEQDLAAEVLLEIVHQNDAAYRLTPNEVAEVRRTQEGLRDGTVRLLTHDEAEEMWRRLGA